MTPTHTEPIRWKSSITRVLVLALGWTFALAALASTAAGLVVGLPPLFLAGALAGFLAWAMAKVVPEPVVVMPKAPRRRRALTRRFSGHNLPT